MDYILVLSTINDYEKAKEIARILVEEGLVACTNIVPGVTSIYSWQGEICEDNEWLMLCKTEASYFNKLKARISSLHSYEVPEVISVKIDDGLDDYLKWISNSLT